MTDFFPVELFIRGKTVFKVRENRHLQGLYKGAVCQCKVQKVKAKQVKTEHASHCNSSQLFSWFFKPSERESCNNNNNDNDNNNNNKLKKKKKKIVLPDNFKLINLLVNHN